MNKPQNVWIHTHYGSVCSLYGLSFPNQFDARTLEWLNEKEDKTDEEEILK